MSHRQVDASRSRAAQSRVPRFALLVFLLVLSGCNFVQLRAEVIRRKLGHADMRAHDAEVGDAELHYWASESLADVDRRRRDDRPIALLVHGFGASAMWQWHEQVGPLSETHRLLVPDLLWFGESSSKNRDFSLDHQVTVMLALLDSLDAKRVDLVGISYGGLVAYELASQHPDRVGRLVVADSPGRVYQRDDYEALCRRFGVRHISEVLVPKSDEGVSTLMSLAYADPPWVPDWARSQIREGLYGEFRSEKGELLGALLADLAALRNRPDPQCDTLLVWGRQDPVFPLSIGRRLDRHLGRRATLVIVDDAKHAPNLEHPILFNQHLTKFLGAPRDG